MLTQLPREQFLTEHWDYRPGEHVSLIYPTGGGKTRLMFQLLQRAMKQNPQLGVLAAMPK